MSEQKKFSLAGSWVEAKKLIWEHRRKLAAGFLLMIINRLAGLVLPGSSKFLIDNVIGEGQTDLLVPLAVAVGLATVVQAGTSFGLAQVISVTAQRAIMDMRRRVQEHVIRFPVRFFDQTQTGKLISRIMTDAEGIRNLVGTGIVQLIGGFLTASLALAVLFYLNTFLTLITLGILTFFGGAMAFSFRRLRPIFRERSVINAEVTGRLGESLGGIRIVKAYGREESEGEVFASGVFKLFRNVSRSITGISAITAFSTLIIGTVGVSMMLIGGRSILAGTMTLGDFVMYVFFTGLLAAPIIQMASIGTQVSEALAGLDRIRELLEETTEGREDAGREPVENIDGRIELKNVVFAYNEGVPVLNNISFQAPSGTTTALVGPSGSGKSTLVSLIMAFNQPQEGVILLDDRDLSRLRLQEYRRSLGVVLQDNFLFDGTIADNIRFSRPEASMADVQKVSQIANCHTFIEELVDGYDTIVGERGVKLSGGQRQRIAIARALLANPRILILDEATSSLDSESEALIQEGLYHLRTGRTTFVIAHRLSTIRSADQIIVLDDGKIVEQGDHESLLALGGMYRDLYERQYSVETDRYLNPGEDVVWGHDDGR